MNSVPLVPITIVRAPGWPLDQTSALKPAGSFTLSSGTLSSAVTIGGVGCGLGLRSWLLASGFDLSMALKPGGAAGAAGAAGGCCAAADQTANGPTIVAASNTVRSVRFVGISHVLP